jgi:CheY-like chemotaxis protein
MEAVGRLAAGVAHDFNNLLTIVSSCSQILLAEAPARDESTSLLTEIQKAGDRAAALTRQLLTFSRRQVLAPKVLELNAVVANSQKMLKRLLGEDVEVLTVLAPGLGRVKTDPDQIEQVLMNLAINARDAMPQGGRITIETTKVTLDDFYCRSHPEVKQGDYISLMVSDTGFGMDEQTRLRIFEPFFTTKHPGKGTGLGLAMVYGFIQQSGGHIDVDSQPGLGATFKLYLPEVEEVLASSESSLTLDEMPRGAETILVAEDDNALLKLTRRVLQSCGYTVLGAADGDEAIGIAQEHTGPIHLLVSDVVMPQMGGRQLGDRIITLKPGIKVLYFSGYTADTVVRHGIFEPEIAFLEKPFTASLLARKVRQVLDHSASLFKRSSELQLHGEASTTPIARVPVQVQVCSGWRPFWR